MKWNKLQSLIISLAIALVSSTAFAYDEPFVNLGQTSFLDGGPPDGPGFYFQDYLQYYSSNRFNDNNGDKLPFPRQNLYITANTFQLIYLSPQKIFCGPHWAFNIILPWLVNANINDGLHNNVLKAENGIGDITAGPILQFDPIMGANGPRFVQRFELDFIIPVGRYNRNDAVNPSSNFWSVNPYWAATLWFTPKWSASTRLHYLWNAKNTDPNISFGPVATSTQAGQAIFGNFATEYEVIQNWRLGINGYFFNQITDTKVNGSDVSGRRERVWAIGPGMLYSFSQADALFLNTYFEQDVRNRPQGNNYVLRYVHHFN